MTTAREIMTSGTRCIDEGASVLDAAKRMVELDLAALPICGKDHKLRGMITEHDIARILGLGTDPATITTGSLANKDPITIEADDDAAKILHTMATHKTRSLPVVDNRRRLLGTVISSDAAQALPAPEVQDLKEMLLASA